MMTGGRAVWFSLAPLLFALAFLPTGCSKSAPRTGIVVEITSDLAIPDQMTAVRLAATASGGTKLYEASFSLVEAAGTRGVALPLRVGFFAQNDNASGSMSPFRIEAVGLLGQTVVVSRSATVGFIKNRILLLPLPLLAACKGVSCADAATTCSANGSCQPDMVDPSGLPTYRPGSDGGADSAVGMMDAAGDTDTAAMDAIAMDATTTDVPADAATMDIASDAGTMDTAPVDATPADVLSPGDALADRQSGDGRDAGADAVPDGADAPDGADGAPSDVPTEINTLNDGLVGYWSFDQAGTTFADHSGNGNTGTLSPPQPPAWIPTGAYGGAVDLTVTGTVVSIPASPSVNSITSAITMAAWVRPPPAGEIHTILSRFIGIGYWKLGFADNGSLRVTLGTRVVQAAGAVGDGTRFVHVAATYDGATTNLYVGGTLAVTAQVGAISLVGGTVAFPGYGALVGASFEDITAVNTEPLNAAVDEVTIHNRGLTAAEISALARGIFPMRR